MAREPCGWSAFVGVRDLTAFGARRMNETAQR